MLRVLVLSTLFPDTSRPNFGIFVERQTLALIKRPDIDVRVIAPIGIPPAPLSLLPRYRGFSAVPLHEEWQGLGVHRPRFRTLPLTGGRRHAAALAAAVEPVARALRTDFPFDVISAQFFFPEGVAAVELGRRLGVPVSIKARGSDIHFWGRSPTVAPQMVSAARSADGLLAVSDALGEDMIALGMPAERIDISLTGVNLSRFAPRDRAAAKAALDISGPLVVSVGALIPLKGHDLVIDAVAALPGVHLWIAGSGPEHGRLAKKIAAFGLQGRVRLLGSVPHDQLPEILAAADVMALASEREGLANAWLEALASGTPVVIPDVGGARQVVGSAAAGRLVARTPEAFAEAIAAVLASPPDQGEVRAAAEPFTWAANSAHLHAHFSQLVRRHRDAIGSPAER